MVRPIESKKEDTEHLDTSLRHCWSVRAIRPPSLKPARGFPRPPLPPKSTGRCSVRGAEASVAIRVVLAHQEPEPTEAEAEAGEEAVHQRYVPQQFQNPSNPTIAQISPHITHTQ